MRAIVYRKDRNPNCAVEEITHDFLETLDLKVRVIYSTINFKDALCVTAKAPIAKKSPLIPGVDLVGEVIESQSPQFSPGDKIIATGNFLGEAFNGGFSEIASVKSEWAIALPEFLSPFEAMAIGTAGLSAMLCVNYLNEKITPEAAKNYPIAVTGVTGGVGSIALIILDSLGYKTTAISSKGASQEKFLRDLGAEEVIDSKEITQLRASGLQTQRFAGAIDAVGGTLLSKLLLMISYEGVVCACGLAGGNEIHTNVYPFILRAIDLKGIESVICPKRVRQMAWDRFREVDINKIKQNVTEISLDEVISVCNDMIENKIKGRFVIKL